MYRTVFELIRKDSTVDIDRLMIFVIVGRRTYLHCLRREVGIGLRSQEVSGELDKSAAMVAGWKKDSSGGLETGGRCGEEVLVPDRIEDRSL